MKLRLTTQGRFALSGFSDSLALDLLPKHRWRVYGDITATNRLLMASDPRGIALGKDGRMMVANGQNICNIHEECELELLAPIPPVNAEYGWLLVFNVVKKEAPSPEKTRNMEASPVKPNLLERLHPRQETFFDNLTPQRKR